MSKRRIALVLNEVKYSGAFKIAFWVANCLSKQYSVSIITIKPSSIVLQGSISDRVELLSLQITEINRIKRVFLVIKKLSKWLKTHEYDILLSFHPLASFEVIVASIFKRTKVVVCERTDPWSEKGLVISFCRLFFRFADFAVFQTTKAQEYYPRSLRKRSCVISNPAFSTHIQFIPYNERPKKIAHVSRLYIQQKRQDLLVKSFALFSQTYPDYKLYIYGDGPDEEIIIKMIQELGLNDKVILCGKTNTVLADIADSRMFILTSDYEGIPNVVLESLSVGVPCICTDCSPGGVRGLIDDGDNGFIVPRNNPEAIVAKMKIIENNPSLAEKMAKNGLLIVEKFSEDIISSQWNSMIQQLLLEGKQNERVN